MPMGTEFSLTFIDGLGIFGAFLVLSGYFLLQSGWLRGSDNRYALLVMFGNGLLLTSLFKTINVASATVQGSFVVISVYGIIRREIRKRRLHFSEADQNLIREILPDMPQGHARRFLDLGTWSTAREGMVLMREGEDVLHLIYIDDAVAEVRVGDLSMAKLTRCLVGEINAVTQSPASATVEITVPGRIFVVSGAALAAQMARDSEFRVCLENALNRELGRKLVRSNAQRAFEAQQSNG